MEWEMAAVSIKCPNCGGALELDDSKEFGFCIFCGTQVHIQDEKTRVEVSGSVKLDETDKYRNYLTLATRAFEARNMSEAYTYYTKALEIKQNDYLPVFRKALCAGYLSDDLGLRIEEVVSGISIAYDMVTNQSIQKNMSDEIVTFALTDQLQVVTTFYSSDECARYAQCVYDRVILLNRLYTFLDKSNADSISKYIETTIRYCKQVSTKTMQYVAGTTMNKGKSKAVFGTYPVPQNIVSDVAAIKKRMADEFNQYIRPKIEMVKSEIRQINEQIKALPQSLRIFHAFSSWWVLLIGVIMFVAKPPVCIIIGAIICVAWIAMLIVFKVKDKGKTAGNLYKQRKAKKKELAQLKKQLKK
jgi:hypothetical protein